MKEMLAFGRVLESRDHNGKCLFYFYEIMVTSDNVDSSISAIHSKYIVVLNEEHQTPWESISCICCILEVLSVVLNKIQNTK